MSTIKILLVSILVLGLDFLRAQDSTAYQRLVSTGAIPKDFITSSADKYKKEVQRLADTQSDKKKDTKLKRRFALESNFVIDDLLQSGKVLFNDEVSRYLADVVKILEQAQPLPGKINLKIYALRSTSVNAFATDRGEIFVTLGLLAQLENEAQLAYILSHEMVHVEKKHGISLFLKSEKLGKRDSDRSVLQRTVISDKTLAKCAYSKENETEADKLGLDRFLKTQYHTGTLPTVCDVLKYAYLPFDDESFDRELIQSEYYRLPADYWLENVQAIKGLDENTDEEHSTHPNLKSRREYLTNAIENVQNNGKQHFIVSEARFIKARRIARYELPMLYLHSDEFSQAIYASGLLLAQQPNNIFLEKCLLKALYFNAKFKNDSDYKYTGDFKDIEGESQQVFHLLEKIPAKEAIVLALQTGWAMHLKYPTDTEIKEINDDLCFELARKFDDLNDFKTTLPISDTTSNTEKTKQASNSKYDKIRKQNTQEGNPEYWRWAFVQWAGTDEFKKTFETAKEKYLKDRKRDKFLESSEGRKKLSKTERKNRIKGLSLDIPKIVVVNPFYMKLDQRKENAVQFSDTETGQDNFRDLIRDVAEKADLDVAVLDVCHLKENQAETFNDIRFLNEWFSEQVNHYELSLTPGYEQARIEAIAKKYGTDYFLWTGVISMREKRQYAALKIIGSLVFFFPSTPFVAYASLKPDFDMLHYAILYDVKTGRRQVLKFDTFDKKDSDILIKAHLYDTFLQIKRKKK